MRDPIPRRRHPASVDTVSLQRSAAAGEMRLVTLHFKTQTQVGMLRNDFGKDWHFASSRKFCSKSLVMHEALHCDFMRWEAACFRRTLPCRQTIDRGVTQEHRPVFKFDSSSSSEL
eukprot:scaffold340_cov256-Pinguiococcus_pyrenoidosus.AAC.16